MRGLFSEMKWRKTEELHNHSTDKPLDRQNRQTKRKAVFELIRNEADPGVN